MSEVRRAPAKALGPATQPADRAVHHYQERRLGTRDLNQTVEVKASRARENCAFVRALLVRRQPLLPGEHTPALATVRSLEPVPRSSSSFQLPFDWCLSGQA
jgi:hypothetical protein